MWTTTRGAPRWRRSIVCHRSVTYGNPLKTIGLDEPSDETIKLEIIRNCLRARAAHAPLFARGSYQPLAAHGPLGAHIFAFARRAAASGPDDAAVIVVPRLTHALAPTAPPLGHFWRDTELYLPGAFAATRWHCAISHREIIFPSAAGPNDSAVRVPLAQLLAASPIALLLPIQSAPP